MKTVWPMVLCISVLMVFWVCGAGVAFPRIHNELGDVESQSGSDLPIDTPREVLHGPRSRTIHKLFVQSVSFIALKTRGPISSEEEADSQRASNVIVSAPFAVRPPRAGFGAAKGARMLARPFGDIVDGSGESLVAILDRTVTA